MHAKKIVSFCAKRIKLSAPVSYSTQAATTLDEDINDRDDVKMALAKWRQSALENKKIPVDESDDEDGSIGFPLDFHYQRAYFEGDMTGNNEVLTWSALRHNRVPKYVSTARCFALFQALSNKMVTTILI